MWNRPYHAKGVISEKLGFSPIKNIPTAIGKPIRKDLETASFAPMDFDIGGIRDVYIAQHTTPKSIVFSPFPKAERPLFPRIQYVPANANKSPKMREKITFYSLSIIEIIKTKTGVVA